VGCYKLLAIPPEHLRGKRKEERGKRKEEIGKRIEERE
jgi:hypothetical protein